MGPPSQCRCRMPSQSGFLDRKGACEAPAPLQEAGFQEKRTRDEGRKSALESRFQVHS